MSWKQTRNQTEKRAAVRFCHGWQDGWLSLYTGKDIMQGRIIKGVAGAYYVRCDDQCVYECRAKGIFRKEHKKPLVGDFAEIEVLDPEAKTGTVCDLLPRKNTLFRPSVANVDQAAIVFACRDPEPNPNLLDRFLIIMESLEVPALICLTKADLSQNAKEQEIRRTYEQAGYPVCIVSVQEEQGDLGRLKELLKGKVTAFAGPSGVGKSSLLNYLHPQAAMETGAISEKIRRGKHTTRHTELFFADEDTCLFDTPGFSSLEYTHLEKEKLELYFPEMDPYLGQCRFHGCTHISEPDCAVKAALAEGKIPLSRYENYKLFYQELASRKKY